MSKLQLTNSVGINGINRYADVLALQKAFNQRIKSIFLTKPLKEDGNLGPNPEKSETVAAIITFQRKIVGIANPDGKVDVNGRTHNKINEMPIDIQNSSEILTFPGTTFVHGKTKMTLSECTATLPDEMRADFKSRIIYIITEMHKLGFAFGAPKKYDAGYRTFQDQFLIPPGKTNAGPGESFHNYGLAADLGVLNWVDKEGKSYPDFWLGTMDKMAEYRGFSAKIWAKRNSLGGANVHSLSWEIIHLQGVSAQTSGPANLVKCLNQAAGISGFSYQYNDGKKCYQCKVSNTTAWVDIGTAKAIWSGAIKNVSATDKVVIADHMKNAESIAKTILL